MLQTLTFRFPACQQLQTTDLAMCELPVFVCLFFWGWWWWWWWWCVCVVVVVVCVVVVVVVVVCVCCLLYTSDAADER